MTQARICFGGINPDFVHAVQTEHQLVGKDLCTNETLQQTFQCLQNELRPDWILPDADPEYRKNLAISLFYRFILNTCPAGKVSSTNKSGGNNLYRPLSSGIQTFETDKNKWPLNEPVLKYEGLVQCSGEAKYVNDLPPQLNELWAAFVPATQVRSKIGKIDTTEALVI